ncbi:pyridoxamine 5'-phosphate oxidase family protein [Enterococcus faecalis 13-SD-W-01]|nr:pyridoxamine 5'-phosphate oxidase family protein [Enterococcus faecalis 13-SD-W-01]
MNKKVIDFLTENPIGDFATIGRDKKPQLRPMGNYFEREGHFYFVTGANKETYHELLANPYAQFCVRSPQMSWLRLSGKAVFIESIDEKKEIFNHSETLQRQYTSADDPTFKPFYLDEVQANLYQFGQEPQLFSF